VREGASVSVSECTCIFLCSVRTWHMSERSQLCGVVVSVSPSPCCVRVIVCMRVRACVHTITLATHLPAK
jgi:hypothetical protein